MAYTPKEWQCDDFITAGELNRMERGIQEAMSINGIKTKTIHPIISQTTIQANNSVIIPVSFPSEEMEDVNTIIAYRSIRFVNPEPLSQMFLIAPWIDGDAMMIYNPTQGAITVSTGDIDANIAYV